MSSIGQGCHSPLRPTTAITDITVMLIALHVCLVGGALTAKELMNKTCWMYVDSNTDTDKFKYFTFDCMQVGKEVDFKGKETVSRLASFFIDVNDRSFLILSLYVIMLRKHQHKTLPHLSNHRNSFFFYRKP